MHGNAGSGARTHRPRHRRQHRTAGAHERRPTAEEHVRVDAQGGRASEEAEKETAAHGEICKEKSQAGCSLGPRAQRLKNRFGRTRAKLQAITIP